MKLNLGLKRAKTDDLRALLKFLHQGKLPYPLERKTLLTMGMNALADYGDLLIGLDERGLRSVLVATLAERMPD